MKLFIYLTLIMLVMLSCEKVDKKNNSSQTKKEIIKREIKENLLNLEWKTEIDFSGLDVQFADNKLFVLNMSDQQLVEFDPKDGKQKSSYFGKGNGPREFRNMANFNVFDDVFYIYDSAQRKIKIITKNGDIKKIIAFKDDFFPTALFFENKKSAKLFGMDISNSELELKTSFASYSELLDNPQLSRINSKSLPKKNILILGGQFVESMYFFQWLGKVAVIGNDSLSWYKTINHSKANAKVIRKGEATFFDRKSPLLIRDQAKHGNEIHILTNDRTMLKNGLFVDVYLSDGFKYSHSYKIPFLQENNDYPRYIFLVDNYLYCLYGNSLNKYSIRKTR
jgi:hypothetical protein